MSLLISGGRVLEKGHLVQRNILIEGNTIKSVSKKTYDADTVIKVEGKIIMPGVIDPHVHFREPGFEHKEDFLTGSRAAAKGGVTTFLDMPNTEPPTTTVSALEDKRRLAKKSIVNYGFHFGSTGDNIEEIKKAENTASVKVFMNQSTGTLCVDDRETLKRIFSAARTITVHAEGAKVKEAVSLARECRTRLYLCHISHRDEIDYLRENKGKNIFVEATPHHLFLTDEKTRGLKSFASMKPGLKSDSDVEALWSAIDEGIVDTIGTDHAPHTEDEKKRLISAPYGVPGVETMLPLLLNAVNEKRLSLKRLAELTCEGPARIFGIKRKGYIEAGYDADLVVVDMDLEKEVRRDDLCTKCGWSPYESMMLKGWPVMTLVRGKVVYDNGSFYGAGGKEVEFNE